MINSRIAIILLIIPFSFSRLISQGNTTINAKYCAHWVWYTPGAREDTPYVVIDTTFQFQFFMDGSFTRKDIKYTEKYTPVKGNAPPYKGWGPKFYRTIRTFSGKYRLVGDSIEILSGFKYSDNTLSRFYEMEQYYYGPDSVTYLWDTRDQFNYENMSKHDSYENINTKKRYLKELYCYTPVTGKTDTFQFWTTHPDYVDDFTDLPEPKLLYKGVFLNLSSYVYYWAYDNFARTNNADKTLRSSFYDKHTYAGHGHGYLSSYYYKGSKKDSASLFYSIEYDLSQQGHGKVRRITDSKDSSYYYFTWRPYDIKPYCERQCLISIEHFTQSGKLIEMYYCN